MQSASRTLVKSPPELWELIDQPDRMQGLMCGLIGRATEVTVNERQPESVLRWEASSTEAWIEVQLAEKGWGTNVQLKAEHSGEPTKLDGWLDAVLDELATPQKRPFESMGEPPPPPEPVAVAPSEPVAAARAEPPAPEPETVEPEPAKEPESVQEPEPIEEPAPQAEPVAPAADPRAERPAASRQSMLRRLLGL